MIYYPTWRYHATKDPCVVYTPEEDDALGEEWADSPAAAMTLSKQEPQEPQEPQPKKRGRPATAKE